MDFVEFIIKPRSLFGTALKGDTLFGQLCWQFVNDSELLGCSFEECLREYSHTPFLVVSSAFPKVTRQDCEYYLVDKPTLPSRFLLSKASPDRNSTNERKRFKKQRIMAICSDLSIDLACCTYLSQGEAEQLFYGGSSEAQVEVAHNSINRLSATTSGAQFAPYIEKAIIYPNEMELAVFTIVDQSVLTKESLGEALQRLGSVGFGRDASIGRGRFSVSGMNVVKPLDFNKAKGFYTLAPSLPTDSDPQKLYFNPFIRFGRHGDEYARSAQPFKTPIVMADQGAVIVAGDRAGPEKGYVGCAITHVSKVMPAAVQQGYAPVIPILSSLEGLN